MEVLRMPRYNLRYLYNCILQKRFLTLHRNIQRTPVKHSCWKVHVQPMRKFSDVQVDISKIFKNKNLGKYVVHALSASETKKSNELTPEQIETTEYLVYDLRETYNNIQMLKDSKTENKDDTKFVELLEEELEENERKIDSIENKIVEALLPIDERESFNSINLEITAGAGGQEAMLFANDLFFMYRNYVLFKNWTYEIEDCSESDLGGVKHCSLLINGKNCYKMLQYEAGVHRVQRIPKTEKSGRMHTSTVTVAVLPQPTEVDIEIKKEDLKIETKTARGPGGQHVNKIETAIRIYHLPTGFVVTCEVYRSQSQNRALAMQKLRAKLYTTEFEKRTSQIRNIRKLQVGSANRNEKIRTYNYNQDRITDHRFNMTIHNLERYLGGNDYFDNYIQELQEKHKNQLKEEFIESL